MIDVWQYWAGGIPEADCDSIVELLDNTIEMSDGQIGFGDKSAPNSQYRSSKIGWVNTYDARYQSIVSTIWNFGKLANRNAYAFDIDFLNDIQYTHYYGSTNDKYDWHIDTFWGNGTPYDRKISMVIQLSDPNDYEGGEFQFDPEIAQPNAEHLRQRGTVIAFPSFIRHRVTPVTSGTRKSLVAWIEGPNFR